MTELERTNRDVPEAVRVLDSLKNMDIEDETDAPMFACPFTLENVKKLLSAAMSIGSLGTSLDFRRVLTSRRGELLVLWNDSQMSEATMRRRIGAYIN